MCCRTNLVHLGPSPATPVNRPKANHPLYGSLTAIELPKPREESMRINLTAGTSVTGRTKDVQPFCLPVTTRPVKTRPAEPPRSRTDHAPKPKVKAHQGCIRSPRTSELMVPYETFEGSFNDVAPAKAKKKVAFAEDQRSTSSWSTVVSGDLETWDCNQRCVKDRRARY